MYELKKLFNTTGGLSYFTILIIFRSFFNPMSTVMQALFLQHGFNAIDKGSMRELFIVCVLFIIGNLFLFLYNGTVWILFASFYTKWVGMIRHKLFGHILNLSVEQIENKTLGDWITRLNSDIQVAVSILGHPFQLPHAAYLVANIIISSIMLSLIEPALLGIVIIFVIPHTLLSHFVIAKSMTRLGTDVQEIGAKNVADLNTIINCADTTILYNAKAYVLSRFEESSLALYKANMRIHLRSALGIGLEPLFFMGGYLFILYIGTVWIIEGHMTFADLTGAYQYRNGLIMGIMMYVSCIVNIRLALAGVKRVNETLEIPLEE